jgi:hypothetical protein
MRYAEIIEARGYDSMYQGFRNLWERYGFEVSDSWHILRDFRMAMAQARKYLKREDRIVWYMRFMRVRQIHYAWHQEHEEFSTNSLFDKSAKPPQALVKIDEMWKDVLEQWEREMGYPLPYDPVIRRYMFPAIGQLSHFVAMADQIPAIRDYRWERQSPDVLIHDLEAMELEWRDQRERDARYIDNQDPVLIQFPDGAMWAHLQRPSCDIEGRAMGHCGNSAAARDGDTILSLRTPTDRKGKVASQLTFILHRDGTLGEMKGRFNQKPAREFHQYIVTLLLNPIVKGIRGGGYAEENNFSLRDLSKADREELQAKKPSLFKQLQDQEY